MSRLVASDPAHQRLRLALRGCLALGGAVAVITLLASLLGQSILAAAPGVIVAMIGTLAVNDDNVRDRLTTLGLGAIAAMGGVSAGAALAGATTVSRIVFVGATAVAILAQRFGPRGMAAGMLAYVSYFVALFVGVPTGSLWWTAIAIAAAAVIAALVKEVVIPDKPVEDLRRTAGAFVLRATQVERAAIAVLEHGDGAPRGRRRRELRRRIYDLRETELAVDERLGDPDGQGSEELHDLVLNATLVAEELAEQATDGRENEGLPAVRRELHDLLAQVRRAGSSAVPSDAQEDEDGDGADDHDDDEKVDGPSPITRKAIQATVAAAIAVPLGTLISDQRWYWAALGAFVVFTRSATAAESVRRGLERLAGTTVGAAAGIAIGTAVAGNTPAQIALLVVGLFATLYLFPVSYALAMTAITMLLAVLYDLLGSFSDHLLELRVVETALGVFLGSLAALVILPMSTKSKIRDSEDDLLAELRAFLEDLMDTGGDRPQSRLRGRARAVEQKAHDLRDAAAPLTGPLPGRASGDLRRRVVVLGSFGRSARRLASVLPVSAGSLDEVTRSRIEGVLGRLDGRSADTGAADHNGAARDSNASNGAVATELRRIIRALDALDDPVV